MFLRGYSPEDHAILEAEYQKNPKPDKVSRTNIVDRVSLGEKEVQVRGAKTPHFQNLLTVDRVADSCRSGSKTAARTTAGNPSPCNRTNCLHRD